MAISLTQKYNVAGPRYTSYPTVPYWENDSFSTEKWLDSLVTSYNESNVNEGISLYIHLPFCESLCTFCGCHKRITKRHEVEAPHIDAVLKEWQLYTDVLVARPLIKEIHLGGGTPTFFKPSELKRLIEGIFERADIAEQHEFSFEGHPNNTSKAHSQLLYDLGFRRVSYGVQDYSEKVQKAIHRLQPLENVKRVTDQAREIGYTSVSHDLVFGLPFQTLDDVLYIIDKSNTLRPDRIAFYSYAHVPWIKGNGQRGFKDEDVPSGEVKRQLYEEGKERLLQVGYAEIGMDHFALPTDSMYRAFEQHQLYRNFMGYTASKTQVMTGLGMSAISDSWYGLAQNEKDLEAYYERLEKNEISVCKGHTLNPEDLIIRRHIFNLMCQFTTSWVQPELQFVEIDQVLQQLSEMEKDGLLYISEKQIDVTDEGKKFIRNICMAFDPRLQRKMPETKTFSMTV